MDSGSARSRRLASSPLPESFEVAKRGLATSPRVFLPALAWLREAGADGQARRPRARRLPTEVEPDLLRKAPNGRRQGASLTGSDGSPRRLDRERGHEPTRTVRSP